ncbi:hypothetical protein PRZ48_003637 [Zasmidium cellare]|uniref:Peroxin 11C n=1 Tax=Zasmidium cellare TaxID=395010 RepID=A0ABR0EVZ7_ZASCE|nr:hypothetical protein PRZ48_003637 [Zasmidium cellare]
MPSQSIQRLRTLLLLSSKQTDSFLVHLTKLLSTTTGIDATLCTLQYTLTLVHSQLVRLLTHKYEKLAFSIASKASETMLPGEALVATIEAPHVALTEWCAGVKSLGEATDDVRTFMRLWGLVNIYTWARETYLHPKRDPAIKFLVWARIFASAGFQFYENGAYLIKKGVLRGQKWADREPRWWVWSSRFWMAEVLLEMLRLLRVRQLKYNEEFGAEKVDQDDKEIKVQSKELEQRWWKDLYANAGWFAPSLHYSFHNEEHSPVREGWLGLSGLIPATIALREAWRETA